MILDEATSSIDSESEQLIQIASEKLTSNRTSIIIAHRLSTIKAANKILVLDKGKLIESGNHEELMQNKGIYFELNQSNK
jgi:subfamily B ATP-binding cassette protein MsbA